MVFLLLGYTTSYAQTPTSFPEDDGEFIEAFSAYIVKSKREESYNAVAAFAETYNGLPGDLKAVVKAVPESKADVSHIRYYSNRMVKDGDITQDQHDKYSTKKAPAKKAVVKAVKAVKAPAKASKTKAPGKVAKVAKRVAKKAKK